MLNFIPLSSGSSGNAYLCKTDGAAPLLIDAGIPYQALQRKLWNEGTSGQGLAGCLISHGHGDHCEAVPKLIAAGVNCYTSTATWNHIGLTGHRCKTFIREHGTETWQAATIGSWRVMPFSVPHDLDVMGFMVEDGSGDRLVYATDLAYAPDRFEGVNIFCLEANFSEQIIRDNVMSGALSSDRFKRTTSSHMSIERVVDLLRANDLSKCRAIYLLHGSAMNSDSADFKRQVQRATGIATYVCRAAGGAD